MRTSAFIVATLLASSVTFAGAYLESSQTESGSRKAPDVNRMWFDGGRMRTENGGRGEGSVAIFKDQAMYVIDPRSKTYRRIDKAALDQMAAKLGEARKKMEAAMANMPPERREMMEKMMGQMGAGAAGSKAAKRSLKNTGRTETVAGIKCTVWEASVAGKKEEELCAAPPGSVPGGDEMMKTLREVGVMLKSFTDNFGASTKADDAWRDMDTINGVPILTRDFSEGKVTSETRLSVARKESVAGSQFEIPAGYTEKKLELGAPAAE